MAKKLEEITITFLSERFRFENPDGDVIIGEGMRTDTPEPDQVSIKGPAEGDDPMRHQVYRLYGFWSVYENKRTGIRENQFCYKTFIKSEPHSRAGVISYLTHAPGIGSVLARRLWDKFGSQAVRILREQPDVAAAAVDRLGDDAALEASTWLEREKALEDCTIDLIGLLDGRGFPKTLAKDIVKTWGNAGVELVKRDPFRLMRFRGCGFKRCDALYLDLGHDPAALKRQALCAWYAVASNTNGNTWHYVGAAEAAIKGSIAGTKARVDDALRLAARGNMLARKWTDGKDGPIAWDGTIGWVADHRKAANEQRAAEYVAEAMGDTCDSILTLDGATTGHQREELYKAISGAGCIGILGGSPGTGKTFTAAVFIKAVIKAFGSSSICVAAPTGKAAVRITEAMQSYKIPLRAKTIHSLLKVEQADDGSGWSFAYRRGNPLEYRFIVVDESSMIDTDLMASLLAARAPGAFILFVGDVNQLSPVGHGAPLRDMIAAGVPYGELTEIHRNDGGIVQACADMRDGKRFKAGGNLESIELASALSIVSAIKSVLSIHQNNGIDPVWDHQILCAVNAKSHLSRRSLNVELQKHLNINPPVAGSPFRLADKVINTKNGYYPTVTKPPRSEEVQENERGEVYVANGEMGCVVKVEPKYLEVRLTLPDRHIRIPRGKADDGDGEESTGTGCNWELGYAISTHKSQGSEWPYVIVVIDEYPGARQICDRAWVYTAISRARKACILVGKLETAQQFATVNNIAKRKTFLRELIEHEVIRRNRHGEQKAIACQESIAAASA